ncbi:MAG TPA: NAD(P)-dependent alcohol dehydrogenase [Actinomycetota bacterium]|nr:NAD(P)-dependent alcohol dehydrogenase [Actinomycetota bacterium]
MRAIVHDGYGTADGLELREVDRPAIGDNEILVKVRAAGVDRGVWHVMTGLPYPIRLAGYGLRTPKNPVLGSDVAGVVESIGKDVTSFAAGDEVFGVANGSFADYAIAREDRLARKPANLGFEQAAAVPTSASTALQGMRDKARVQPGEKVLVIGASGGVGTYAVQVAKALGADVTAVCSTAKVDLVRSIGADRVLDYTRDDFAAGDRRYDVIFDVGGNSTLSRLRRALTPDGRLVIAGGETGGRWLGGADRQIRAQVLSLFVGQKLGTFIASVKSDDLDALRQLIEDGKVTPVMDRSYELVDAPAAIVHLEEGRARGKVVITV